jgi:hypothetical protein
MSFELRFVPSAGNLSHWSCSYRTFEQLITAVVVERALGARGDELFVSCPPAAYLLSKTTSFSGAARGSSRTASDRAIFQEDASIWR